MAEEADQVQRYGGKGISAGDQKQNDFRVKPDDAAEKQEKQNEHSGLLATPGEILKAVEADGTGHQAAQRNRQRQPCYRPVPILDGPFMEGVQRPGIVKGVHDGGNDAGRSRSGHADEILRTAGSHALHVETGQPPGTTYEKSQAAEPSEAAQLAKGFGRKVGDR